MATAAVAPAPATYNEALAKLEAYKANGVDQSESDAFVKGAIETLEADKGKGTFASNVEQVAGWAIQIDEAFDKVTRGLSALTDDFGKDFPDLSRFLGEWKGYNKRWVHYLTVSREAASEHAALLKRFDQVFITMVMNIKTDQDRKDVIAELGQFINEKHDQRATEMQQGFLNLKRDVEDFVKRFDAWVEKTGTELAERAKQLQGEIEAVKKELETLDKKIKEGIAALLASAAGATTMVGVLGLVVSGTTLAFLIAQRISKAKELVAKQKELEDVNRKQKEIAKIKSDFDGLRPSIALICDRLVMFAEIWSSVKSQSIQFQETLKEGMEALSDERFKLKLKLAKELCDPLRKGLDMYATSLVNKLPEVGGTTA